MAKADPSPTSITFECTNAPLKAILKEVAKKAGLNLQLEKAVSASTSTKSLKFGGQSLELAMAQALNKTPWKHRVFARTVFVGTPAYLDAVQKGRVRQEVLLEHQPAEKVMNFLAGQYPLVEFVPHPTSNGFYMVGPSSELDSIKRDVPNLDRIP